MNTAKKTSVFITGANGYVGAMLLHKLSAVRDRFDKIIAFDVRECPADDRIKGVDYRIGDIRTAPLTTWFRDDHIDTVVHLASIVNAKGMDESFVHAVDVGGTQRVLEACVEANAHHVIVTSSGAAYGYYPDNPEWLDENDPIRGNDTFLYSKHKRMVEEMLAEFRASYPTLQQLIFRPGTILGYNTDNQITDLFNKNPMLGLWETDIPFVFIWDEDVVACILQGILEKRAGIYNLAGDGVVTMREIAHEFGRVYLPLPAFVLKVALTILKRLNLTQYGPEQVDFIRYRPVLSNRRLKEEFGYTPQKTSRETFDYYLQRRNGP